MEQKLGDPGNKTLTETTNKPKNTAFVMLHLVTGTWKYVILKGGILLQLEIQGRKIEIRNERK
jgi:hypothetical protein